MNLSVLFPPPSAPLVHFFSFFNQSPSVCVLIHLHPVSPLLITPSPSSPPSVSDRCPSLLAVLIQQSMSTYSRSSASRFADVHRWLSAALLLLGSVLEKNPFAVVSLPVDSNVCDSFCKPLLGTFRDCAFRTFPPHCC